MNKMLKTKIKELTNENKLPFGETMLTEQLGTIRPTRPDNWSETYATNKYVIHTFYKHIAVHAPMVDLT